MATTTVKDLMEEVGLWTDVTFVCTDCGRRARIGRASLDEMKQSFGDVATTDAEAANCYEVCLPCATGCDEVPGEYVDDVDAKED